MVLHYSHYETLACEFLQRNGHVVLHRNYRVGRAEIDLVSSKNSALYLIEVKYRRCAPPSLEDVVFPAQWRRVARAGAGLLQQHPTVLELEMWLFLFTAEGSEPLCYPIDLS